MTVPFAHTKISPEATIPKFFVECGAEKIFAAIKVENWVNCCNLSCSCSASIPGSVFFFFSGVGDDDDDDDDDDCDGVANV